MAVHKIISIYESWIHTMTSQLTKSITSFTVINTEGCDEAPARHALSSPNIQLGWTLFLGWPEEVAQTSGILSES